MSKLDQLTRLYQIVENCEECGLSLPHGTIDKINVLESEIISDKVAQLFQENIEPTLKQLKRPFKVEIDYDPSIPVEVKIFRKSKVTNDVFPESQLFPDSGNIFSSIKSDTNIEAPKAHENEAGAHKEEPMGLGNAKTKSMPTSLTVYFDDGTVLSESTAAETMRKAVIKMGVEKAHSVVNQLGLTLGGMHLITNQPIPKYKGSLKPLGNGLFLMTNCNNHKKARYLKSIANALNIGISFTIDNKPFE